MAETKTIIINVDTKNTDKNLKEVNESLKDIKQSSKLASKEVKNTDKGIEDLGKSSKSSTSGLKAVGTGVKGVGNALKAAGIGLIIAAFVSLKTVFEQNQKVADFVSAAFETVSIVFNKVTEVLTNVFQSVSKSTNGFQSLGKVMSGLLTIAVTPLKLTFYAIKLAIQAAQLGWEKSVFGSGDLKTIKALKESIKETKDEIVGVGKGAVDAAIGIGKNVVGAIKEVSQFTVGAIDGISKISVKSAFEQAKASVQAQTQAEIAAAQQGLLVEQYDKQAEKLRQIRDEERNSIDDRIKANDRLKEVLENQQKAMLATADMQVTAVEFDYKKNKSIENRVALIEAQANREGVLAQIEGLRSEQLANDLALDREKIELSNAKLEAAELLSISEKKFLAEQIVDDEERLKRTIEILNEEKLIELKRLEEKVAQYKEGTQLKLDAESELNTRTQELGQELVLAETELNKVKNAKIEEQRLLKNETLLSEQELEIENLKTAYAAKLLLAKDDARLTEALIEESEKKQTEIKKKYADIEKKGSNERKKQLIQGVQDGLSIISGLSELFAGKNEAQQKKAFKIQKAANIANALIDTYKGAQSAFASTTGGILIKSLAAGVAVTAGLLNVKKIKSTQFNSTTADNSQAPTSAGGGIGGDGSPSAVTTNAPQFNVVGNTGINQLNNLNQPIQAYVVSGEMTTQQQLDRNKLATVTL